MYNANASLKMGSQVMVQSADWFNIIKTSFVNQLLALLNLWKQEHQNVPAFNNGLYNKLIIERIRLRLLKP